MQVARLEVARELRVEDVGAVGPALRPEEVITPARQERQIAAEAAREPDEVACLMTVVDAEIGESADASRTRERGRGLQRGRQKRIGDVRAGSIASKPRIIDRQLKLAVLLRLATGHEQVGIELPITEEVGVVGAAQVAGVVPRRRDEILLKRRRREGVTRLEAAEQQVARPRVVNEARDAFEAR